ncbi:MAG: hypothetical protein K940chlam8_00199 [Chlamydiae bacterium]|nr:hypothetical protein [Chlamydiota bacterium]
MFLIKEFRGLLFFVCFFSVLSFHANAGIHAHGYWEENINHCYDRELSQALVEFFKSKQVNSIADFGCGDGSYTRMLKASGFHCEGFDGNPFTVEMTDGHGQVLDLAIDQNLDKKYDFVLSLEVGEHIPAEFEETFIQNLHRHNAKGLVLSWAIPNQGGHGHFNEKSNAYIKEKFLQLGYVNNVEAEQFLRSRSTLCWFRNTIMVFEKKE